MNGDYVNSLEEFDTTGMDSVWLAIKIPRKTNDDSRTKLLKIEAARKEWYHCGERKMLEPAVIQRTKDIIDLIRGRLVVAQDGQRIGSRGPSAVIGILLERMDEVRKERKAKPTNYWTLEDIKMYWEVSI
ncbi:hypothetical protein AgCh_024701 [Apium graveolens]